MGCGATKEIMQRAKAEELSLINGIALQSTGALQLILQQSTLRKAFKNYVESKWIPTDKEGDALFCTRARALALNGVDFWTDTRDFCKIKRSPFRTYRAVFIFEKYMMHGAAKQIAVSTNVLDDCVAALFNGEDADIDADVFSAAEAEVLDYLVSEVFPHFEQTSYSALARKQNQQMVRAISGCSEPTDAGTGTVCTDADALQLQLQQRRQHYGAAERRTLTEIMVKILGDREYLAAFRGFLIRRQDEHILHVYHEALDISEKFTELSGIPDPDVRQSIFLHAVNGFYDKFIAMGAGFRVRLPEGTHGDLMRRLANSAGIEHEALLPIEHACFEYMVRTHLDAFLADPAYRQLVRAGRRTVLLLFYQLKVNAEHCAEQDGGGGGDESESRPETDGDTSTQRVARKEAPARRNVGSRSAVPPARAVSTHLPALHEPSSNSEEDPHFLLTPSSASTEQAPYSPLSPLSPLSALSPVSAVSPTAAPKHGLDAMNSEELTAWLARGGRRSSTTSNCSGSSAVPALATSMAELLAPVSPCDMRELKSFIRSGYDELLGRYLESKGQLSLMCFYQSAMRFQEARFNHDVERLSECTMLYDRYICRSADDQVPLPEPIRRDIVRHLLRGQQSIYAVAAQWALHCICAEHWGVFKREVNAAAAAEEETNRARPSGQGAPTLGSVQLTSLDDGSVTVAAVPAPQEAGTYTSDNSLNSLPANAVDDPKQAHANKAAGSGSSGAAPAVSPGRPIVRPAPLSFHDGDDISAVTTLATKAARAFPHAVTSPNAACRGSMLVLAAPACASGCGGVPVLASVPLPPDCTTPCRPLSQAGLTSTAENIATSPQSGQRPFAAAGLHLQLSTSEAAAGAGFAGAGRHSSTGTNTHSAAHITTPHPQHKASVPPRKPFLLKPLTISEGSVSMHSSSCKTPIPCTPHHSVHSHHAASIHSSVRSQLISLASMGHSSASSAYEMVTSGSGKLHRRVKLSDSSTTLPTARAVLEHPQCCSVFKAYLDREGLAQTVLFCIEVEEFRRIPSFDFQLQRARKIYAKYMHELAAMPVPVTSYTRNEILRCISGGVVLPTLFKCAAEEVIRYVEIFQFPRFLVSPEMGQVQIILKSDTRQLPQVPRRSSLTVHAMPLPDVVNLKAILKTQSCTRYFKDYCAKMYCTENLLFWLDVDNYQHLPGSDYMRRVACKIYKKYIADGSKMQVNVSFAVKQEIFAHLMDGDRLLFKKAQNEVFQLMRSDTMPKFQTSTEYALMVQSLKADRQILRPAVDGTAAAGAVSAGAGAQISKLSISLRSNRDAKSGHSGHTLLAPLSKDLPLVDASQFSGVQAGSRGTGLGLGLGLGKLGIGTAVVGVLNVAAGGSYTPSPTAALKVTHKPSAHTTVV